MVSGEELETEGLAEKKPAISKRRLTVALWIGTGVTMIALIAAWFKYSPHAQAKPPGAPAVSMPGVVISNR